MDSLDNENQSQRLQRTMIACALVYLVWLTYFAPGVVPPPVADTNSSSVNQANPVQKDVAVAVDNSNAKVAAPTPPPAAQTVTPSEESVKTGELQSKVTSDEGAMREILLTNYDNLPTLNPLWSWLLSGMDGEWEPYTNQGKTLALLSKEGGFILAGVGKPLVSPSFNVRASADGVVASQTYKGLSITKKYKKTENPFIFDVEIEFQNHSEQPISDVWVGIADELKGDAGRFLDEMRPHMYVDGGVETYTELDDLQKNPEGYDQPPVWFGLGSRYFIAAFAEKQTKQIGSVYASHFGKNRYGSVGYLSQPIPSKGTVKLAMNAYVGPKNLEVLQSLSDEWAEAVEFGIFGFFSRILLFLLKFLFGYVGNWGWAIILLTLSIRILLFPMTQKGYESSKKMQVLQPKLKEIQEKYKDNKQLLSQEMMKLYRENGANPLGGCLPMVIQIPIWFALYSTLLYSVEIYNASFWFLKDLTSPDPYGVLPIIYGVLMYASQKFMTPTSTQGMGEQQQMMMKMMKMMTIVFTFFMFTFPCGLVLYFCCNSILTIVQQWVIKRKFADQGNGSDTQTAPTTVGR